MQRILAAVDGSEPSLRGVFFAAQLAKALGAAVELVYVSFPNLLPPTVYAAAIKEIDAAETVHAAAVFRAAQLSIADQGVTCLTTRSTGAPADAIADLATMDGVWGVVIGAKGHNMASRVLLGSVADRLTHICSKPVTVVR